MDLQVDVLEFQVPVENNKTVFVWNIDPGQAVDQIYSSLWSVFSGFGPIYLLKVCPNAPLAPPGFYALVKFYSCVQAFEAQQQTDGRTLFQNAPLKVRLSSKQTPHFLLDNSPPLSHARCLELANHCLGFNGWTSNIVTIKELTNEEEEEEEEGDGGGVRRRRLRFGCLMELNFPHHGRMTRGAAVVEDSFTCTGPDVMLQKRCKLMKSVKDKALVQAFSTVLLVLLGKGKVMVELKQTSDHLEPEQNQQVLQVNEFSRTEFPHDDDDDDDDDEGWPLDLTVS